MNIFKFRQSDKKFPLISGLILLLYSLVLAQSKATPPLERLLSDFIQQIYLAFTGLEAKIISIKEDKISISAGFEQNVVIGTKLGIYRKNSDQPDLEKLDILNYRLIGYALVEQVFPTSSICKILELKEQEIPQVSDLVYSYPRRPRLEISFCGKNLIEDTDFSRIFQQMIIYRLRNLGLFSIPMAVSVKSVYSGPELCDYVIANPLGKSFPGDLHLNIAISDTTSSTSLLGKLISVKDNALVGLFYSEVPVPYNQLRASLGLTPQQPTSFPGIWQAELLMTLPQELLDMEIGDLEGDGSFDILLLGKTSFYHYVWDKGILYEKSEIPLSAKTAFIDNKPIIYRHPVGRMILFDAQKNGYLECYINTTICNNGTIWEFTDKGWALMDTTFSGFPLGLYKKDNQTFLMFGELLPGTNEFSPIIKLGNPLINALRFNFEINFNSPFYGLSLNRCSGENCYNLLEVLADYSAILFITTSKASKTFKELSYPCLMANVDDDPGFEIISSSKSPWNSGDYISIWKLAGESLKEMWRSDILEGNLVSIKNVDLEIDGIEEIIALEVVEAQGSNLYFIHR